MSSACRRWRRGTAGCSTRWSGRAGQGYKGFRVRCTRCTIRFVGAGDLGLSGCDILIAKHPLEKG